MSGVIDENGVQWEHCNICGEFVNLQKMWYEEPSTDHPYGRDLCTRDAMRLALNGAKVRRQYPATLRIK